MSAGSSFEDQARDPATSHQVLYQLAVRHPELRPLIAANPNTYQDLLTWLGTLHDPAVNAALAARQRPSLPVAPVRSTSPQPGTLGPVVHRQTVMPKQAASEVPLRAAPRAAPQAAPTWNRQSTPLAVPVLAPEFPEPEAPPAKRNPALSFLFVALGILATAAAGLVIFLVLGGGQERQPGFAPTPGAVQPSPSGPAEATPGQAPGFPAPAGSLSVSGFSSPSGNISCQIGPDSVLCSVATNNYVKNGFQDCGGGPVTLAIDSGGAGLSCSSVPVGAGQEALPYNSSTVVGDFACLSTESGMNCWNTSSGQSFILARDGWTLGNEGVIPADRITWN